VPPAQWPDDAAVARTFAGSAPHLVPAGYARALADLD
jgi:hypothetical protein